MKGVAVELRICSQHADIPALPHRLQPPQTGYNRCLQGEGAWNANASCQTAWVNSADDFCLWGPPKAGSEVGVYERDGECSAKGRWVDEPQ